MFTPFSRARSNQDNYILLRSDPTSWHVRRSDLGHRNAIHQEFSSFFLLIGQRGRCTSLVDIVFSVSKLVFNLFSFMSVCLLKIHYLTSEIACWCQIINKLVSKILCSCCVLVFLWFHYCYGFVQINQWLSTFFFFYWRTIFTLNF